MSGPNFPYTKLDYQQVIKNVYDESTDRLRTDSTATIVVPPGGLEVNISDLSDSIKIGDGSGVYLDINPDGSINEIRLNSLVPYKYDTINATYPTTTEEIYTYKYLGSTVAVVTVDYVDATKERLVSIVRT